MAFKASLPLFLLLSFLFLASFAVAHDEDFDDLNPHHQLSPRQEYQQCQSRCQEQFRGGQQQQLCEQRCEQRMRQRERSEEGGGSRESRERELREEFEQCKQDCQRHERGQQQQRQQCERRCEQKYEERRREEQQRQERERRRRQGEESENEEETGGGSRERRERELRQEFEQCRRDCERHERGQQQQRQQCERSCEQEYEQRRREEQQREEKERRRRHGGQSENEEETGGGGREHRERELRQELEQCRRDCESRERGQQQQRQQCERRCEQEYEQRRREEQQREERERRRRQGGQSENEEETGGGGRERRERELRQELEQCRRDCESRERGQQQQRQQCERRCEQEYEQRRREEQQREERERRRRQGGQSEYDGVLESTSEEKLAQCRRDCERRGSGQQEQLCKRMCQQRYEEEVRREERTTHDPEEKFRRCQQHCQEQEHVQERRRECQQECQRKYREEEHRGRRRRDDDNDEDEEVYNPQREREWEEREREISPRSQGENPYHFKSQRLQSRYRTDEGNLKVLEKLSMRSELLKGLKNYRLVVLEANPNTFVVPHHCDADSVLVVTRGKGTISIVRQNNKESYNIECADVVPVRAGSTVYLVNDQNERLQITKLVTPINTPGQFEEYYAAGGEIPQSYFKAFSTSILKSILSATDDQIEALIGQQREGRRQIQRPGFIKRASQEQLKALTQHASSPRRRGGRESTGPISLHNQSPLYSNNYGKFYEASPEDHKQLEEMDVLVSWTDLKQGSIFVPHYNSKTSVLCMVVEGEGEMEMACPHLSRQRRQQRGQEEEEYEQTTSTEQYQKVTARLSKGDFFIIPAGHPISVVASGGQNLRLVGFGVNARNNERYFIAGKDNFIKQLEREAKELAFNMPGREVEQIFNQPKLSYFIPRESGQEEGGRRSHPLNSILNLAGFA